MEPVGIFASGKSGKANWLITSRRGGYSKGVFSENNFAFNVGDEPQTVARNREKLKSEISKNVIYPVAVHSNKIAWVLENEKDIEDVDGLISSRNDLAVGVFSADCASILIHSSKLGLIAALHAGWKGMKDQILPKAIDLIATKGDSSPEVILGPAICANCYRVDEARYLEVLQAEPKAAVINQDGNFAIDVLAGLKSQLQRYEISYQQIIGCTYELKELYSFRRDGTTGRFASVIWMST